LYFIEKRQVIAGAIGLPVFRIALQDNFLVRFPMIEKKGSRSYRMSEKIFSVFFDCFARDDIAEACGEMLQERRKRLCKFYDNRRIVRRLKSRYFFYL